MTTKTGQNEARRVVWAHCVNAYFKKFPRNFLILTNVLLHAWVVMCDREKNGRWRQRKRAQTTPDISFGALKVQLMC